MVGTHTLIVESLHDKFMINFKRKYTYIKGDSGSGKSLICSLVRDSLKKNSLNIELAYDIQVRVLTDVDLVFAYKDIEGVILVDEDIVKEISLLEREV